MPAALAPAKLNLTLAVGPRSTDGYHPLRSVFLRLGLCDELTVEQAPADADADGLTVSGLPGCPVEGNLVLRAIDALRTVTGVDLPPLMARLDKRIPLGAGLGGGSSDAAAALDLAAACWGIGVADYERNRLAAGLGSDVPFFTAGVPAALVEGRGESVSALPGVSGEIGVLLALGAQPLSTRAVYERFDALTAPGSGAHAATEALAGALDRGLDGTALAAMAGRLRNANDLWPAAADLRPGLAATRATLEHDSGRPWLLTGSGSTLFTLYASAGEARDAGVRLSARPSTTQLATILLATGTALAGHQEG